VSGVDNDRNDPVQQFMAALDTASAAVAKWAERTTAAFLDAVGKLDPAIRTTLENWGLVPRNLGSCECLCATKHPDDVGVCDGEAVITRRVTTNFDGDVDVPLCAPCATAQGFAEMPS
jgi:hypothetical protein